MSPARWISRFTLLLSVSLVVLGSTVSAAGASTTRAVVSWNVGTEENIDLHVFDAEGNTAILESSIPNSTYTPTPGGHTFVDDESPSTRIFCYVLDNYGEAEGVPVTVTLTDPSGQSRTLTFAKSPGEEFIGSSPPGATLSNGTSGSCVGGEPENRPPVVMPERWSVRAGWTVDGNVLQNDSDPDGDSLRARVTSISFARREWSRMDQDGSFFYTAGPGTRKRLVKTITYYAIDERGASSAKTKATIVVLPKKATKSPLVLPRNRRATARRSSGGPYWDGPWGWGRLCFGSGLNASCYTMLSVSRAAELNRDSSWRPDYGTAVRWCLKYGIIPLSQDECAKKLLTKGLGFLWDRSVVHNAAKLGTCLLTRTERNRTPLHPISGTWSSPQYHPTDSLVSRYNGNQQFTGYGTWPKGTFTLDRWRVPLFCGRNGNVYRLVGQSLTVAP